jgi:hypothetical protein
MEYILIIFSHTCLSVYIYIYHQSKARTEVYKSKKERKKEIIIIISEVTPLMII